MPSVIGHFRIRMALLRKMTYKEKASYEPLPPCSGFMGTVFSASRELLFTAHAFYVYSMHTATIQGPLPYYSLPMNSHLATHTQIFFCKNITHNNVHVVPLRTNLAGGLLGTISQKSALQSFHIANLVASCCLRISAIVGILSLALSLYIPPC